MDVDHAYDTLMQASLRFISYRPRSRFEIETFLSRKCQKYQIDVSMLARVMDRLSDYGYIDDKKFSEWWLSQRQSFRPKGERALRMELAQKGVSKEIIVDTINAVRQTNSFSEFDSALDISIHKLKKYLTHDPIEIKKRISAFLFRRGFAPETIGRVIDELERNRYNI